MKSIISDKNNKTTYDFKKLDGLINKIFLLGTALQQHITNTGNGFGRI